MLLTLGLLVAYIPFTRLTCSWEDVRTLPVLVPTGHLYIFTDSVETPIGYGNHGTVVKALDTYTSNPVAVKLFHRDDRLHADPQAEQRTYQAIASGCDPRINLFAFVHGTGTHNGFRCIVFDLCHSTLSNLLDSSRGLTPLPPRHILEIAYQIVCAIEYLHSLRLVHTDLKPDNVAIRHGDTVAVHWLDGSCGFHSKEILMSTKICVIDLGNAVNLSDSPNRHGCVGARPYRAPEVLTGFPWSYGVDAYGVGCILAELYLEEPLVSPEVASIREHLAVLDAVLGPFPQGFAQRINEQIPDSFLFVDGVPMVSFPSYRKCVPVEYHHARAYLRLGCLRPASTRIHNAPLHDLIRRLTRLDPSLRIAMKDAVKHEYFDVLRVPGLRL
ncbi:kinase-like domain-containing protein [Cubamyces lactineus]|nr:kinase-like domain-containing protein [Cubamyces lactineus]